MRRAAIVCAIAVASAIGVGGAALADSEICRSQGPVAVYPNGNPVLGSGSVAACVDGVGHAGVGGNAGAGQGHVVVDGDEELAEATGNRCADGYVHVDLDAQKVSTGDGGSHPHGGGELDPVKCAPSYPTPGPPY